MAASNESTRGPKQDSRFAPAVLAAAAALFLLQPLVVYVAAWDPSDCDDKAVHYFSAIYSRATAEQRQAFGEAIAPFVAASSSDSWWPRTAFRLKSTGAYPVANLVIASAQRPDVRFVDTVKWSLLAVTLLAMLVVVAVAVVTTFGLWPALLTLNLVAWQMTPVQRLFAPVPVNMLPFLSYVPRGAGSLLAIPLVLAFAARRPGLLAACLLAVFGWHLGLGLILLGVTLPAFGLASLLLRRTTDFHDRALVAALAVLAVALLVSEVTDLAPVDAMVQSLMGIPAGKQTSARLLGSETSLWALALVLAGRRLLLAASSRVPAALRARLEENQGPAIASLLAALSLAHLQPWKEVVAGHPGFFEATCVRARSVRLPEDWRTLALHDEPSVFLSFADKLIALRDGDPANAAAAAAPHP